MQARRPHRIIRTAVLTLATTAFFVSGYVSSYFGMWWLTGRGTININTNLRLQETVYRPILHYIVSAGPGSESANKLSIWISSHGRGAPCAWDSIDGKIHTDHGRQASISAAMH